jgi:cyanate lyase
MNNLELLRLLEISADALEKSHTASADAARAVADALSLVNEALRNRDDYECGTDLNYYIPPDEVGSDGS